MTRVLVVCDFDGTITTLDTLNVVADHCIGHARRRELDEDILHERCTFRDGLSEVRCAIGAPRWPRIGPARILSVRGRLQMFSGVRMAWQDAVALLHSRAPGGLVEPSFPDFAHRMLSDSDVALCVVSSGFEQLIRHILHDAGLPALEVHANGLDIDPESSQWRINFRDASSAGHDKVATVQALRQRWPGAKVR